MAKGIRLKDKRQQKYQFIFPLRLMPYVLPVLSSVEGRLKRGHGHPWRKPRPFVAMLR